MRAAVIINMVKNWGFSLIFKLPMNLMERFVVHIFAVQGNVYIRKIDSTQKTGPWEIIDQIIA